MSHVGEGRPMGDCTATTTKLMLPQDANPHGNVHGGVIMKLVDELAGIVAHRHARHNVVTARLDRMDFDEAVFVGDALILEARLAYAGRTSMEIVVDIKAESLNRGEVVQTGVAWLTMIALDDRRRPFPINPIKPETPEEQALYDEAKARYETRSAERKQKRQRAR